jgi:hypothetical protein
LEQQARILLVWVRFGEFLGSQLGFFKSAVNATVEREVAEFDSLIA